MSRGTAADKGIKHQGIRLRNLCDQLLYQSRRLRKGEDFLSRVVGRVPLFRRRSRVHRGSLRNRSFPSSYRTDNASALPNAPAMDGTRRTAAQAEFPAASGRPRNPRWCKPAPPQPLLFHHRRITTTGTAGMTMAMTMATQPFVGCLSATPVDGELGVPVRLLVVSDGAGI